MAVDCPVEDTSIDQWVTERERGQKAEGLQERAKRIISHLGLLEVWWEEDPTTRLKKGNEVSGETRMKEVGGRALSPNQEL